MPDLDRLSDDYLSGREMVPAVVADAMRDSAYLAGLKAGWTCATADDEARYAAIQRAHEGHLAALTEYRRRKGQGGGDHG